MAIQRVIIDSTGQGILALFKDNLTELGYSSTYSMTDLDNRYNSGGNKTYVDRFNESVDSYTVPPDGSDFRNSARSTFNLGQIIGPDQAKMTDLANAGKNAADEFFEDLIETAIQDENQFLADWWRMVSGVVIGDQDRPQADFAPGFSRPSIPGQYGRKAQLPLSEMLEQNLLLPPTGLALYTTETGEKPDISDTFGKLYTDNRADGEGSAYPRFSNGKIAGTGVNDLQEPVVDPATKEVATVQGWTPVPFSFEEDDEEYLTYNNKRSGFVGNTEYSVSNPEATTVAVRDFEQADTSTLNRSEVQDHTDRQYFPFAFSTVNKKNNRVQVCTLQATIQNLSESYNPTWQSKHFFGRSEQVHTYTFTDRTIDISFVVFANSMRELQNVYARVLWLAQQCYPDYSSNDRVGGGPIIAMSVGDLFQYKAGFIRSLSYDWNYLGGAGGKWELTKGKRMPQACNVSISYQVIHERVPDRDYNFYSGPGGGVSEGMKKQEFISYGTVAGSPPPSEENVHRYISSDILTSTVDGEQDYLDHVETVRQSYIDSDSLPGAPSEENSSS